MATQPGNRADTVTADKQTSAQSTPGGHDGRKATLLIGPEPLRRHMFSKLDNALRIDCSNEDAAAAVGCSGLFAQPLHLTRGESLDEAAAKALAAALQHVEVDVIIEADKLTAKPERHLAKVCTTVRPSLEGRNGGETLQRIGSALGLDLSRAGATMLERCRHDPARLVGILEALAAGGYTQPSPAQVSLLVGSSSTEGRPWTLLEHLERGDDQAAKMLETLEPIPTIAFLAKRIQLAAASLEEGKQYDGGAGRADDEDGHGDEIVLLVGVSDRARSDARRMGRRLGPQSCHHLLEIAAQADRLAKRGKGPEALALLCGHIRARLHQPAGT